MTDLTTLLKNLWDAIAKALGRGLTSAEKEKVQADLGLTNKPIGYFIDPNMTPLNQISFTNGNKNGWGSVAIRVTNDGTNGIGVEKLNSVQKTLDKAEIKESLAWVWCNEDSQFTKTKQVAQSQFDGILVDSETYYPDKVLPYLKQLVKDAGNKEVIFCLKPDGWDDNQKYDQIMALDKRVKIAPMTYIDDYGKTIAELGAYYKALNKKYPGRVIAIIETYKGDNNTTPKNNTQIQSEIDAVMPYVVGVLLFRYGLSNYMTKDVAKTGDTPIPPSSGIVQELKDKTGKQFNNFTELYALIKQYGRYCDPMYMDDQKSFSQAQVSVINQIKGIYDPNAYVQSPISGQRTRRDCMTCVDWTQWGSKIAKAMGYETIAYGVYCPVYEILHALFTIKGKEFGNWTIIDLAATAAEGYNLGSHWCNPPSADRKNPRWIPNE